MAIMPMPGLGPARARNTRRAWRRARSRTEAISLTPTEEAQLTALFADQLARGWIPKESDLRDALGALRAATDD